MLWLLAGMLATALSIILSSNLAVLFSLSFLVAIPLCFVVHKKYAQLSLYSDKEEQQKLVIIENERRESELTRREHMRTESSQLQAELVEIQQINDQYERIRRMAQWKMSAGIFQSRYKDLLKKEKRYNDGVGIVDEDYIAVRDR